MILAIGYWMILFTLCQSKYIEVNSEGNNSTDCCINGTCPCGSLYEALYYVENNTIINITSSVVTLHNVTTMVNLDNIKIIGNKVTIACNNSGSLECSSCSDIEIKGITWDQCGNPNLSLTSLRSLRFEYASNISIMECTFQYSKVCTVVEVDGFASGFVQVYESKFLFNQVAMSLQLVCPGLETYGSFVILANGSYKNRSISLRNTLFYHNGPYDFYQKIPGGFILSSAALCVSFSINFLKSVTFYTDNVTVSTTVGLGGYFFVSAANVIIQLTNMNFFNNSNGGSYIVIAAYTAEHILHISSSNYTNNQNGALSIYTALLKINITFHGLIITGNTEKFGNEDRLADSDATDFGVGILIQMLTLNSSDINILHCNIYDNIGSKSSIIFISSADLEPPLVSIISSKFVNNVGSVLHLLGCQVEFGDLVLFRNNSAEMGAALYLEQASQIGIKENSTVKFDRNIALRQGGAIYIELYFGCPNHGIVFTNLPPTSDVSFTYNLAGITGNCIYLSIPGSCDVVKESTMYKFNYSKSVGLPIATSPYTVNLCTTTCQISNDTGDICHIASRNMLGESIGIDAAACDFYGNISESVQFYVECTNCNNALRLSNYEILIQQGLFDVEFLGVDADNDIFNNTNVTLSLFSVLSDEYKQLTATVSVELSSCQSGYVFDANVQKCECYNQSKRIIQCQQDYAEIKYGYWFGAVAFPKRTVSLCPTHYCDYNEATSNGYYKLPKKISDQCVSHRTGIACGECKSGYTLAYDSPDCIIDNNCSAGITVLVVALTILYWIIIVALVFGLMQRKISLGYTYGLIYYYSIMDTLLGSNLFISTEVFQLVTILSSLAKLTPQFLGRLCFIQGLSGIDQQFIHYFHAAFIFSLTGVIAVAARYSSKVASFVSRPIIRVICLLILLAYTSLASTSLQLLRPLYFDSVKGPYVYSSPSIKYFTGRHIPYGIVALLCELFVVIGLPLLLLLEHFLKRKVNFIRIKPLLDPFQECYRNQYRWFAAYYLLCRQVIIAILYISDYYNSLSYLQTVCVIIVIIHVLIQPYKAEILNVLDGVILLTIVLVVNLNSFAFSRSSTIAIVVILVIFPLVLSLITLCTKYFPFMKFTWNHKKMDDDDDEPMYVNYAYMI